MDKQPEEKRTDDRDPGCAATPPEELEKQITDPSIPKNEREWWANRRIEELQGDRLLEREVALLWDLLFICDRFSWQSDVGDKEAQERIAGIHKGKYGDSQGYYVQCKNVLEKLSLEAG